MLHSKCRKLIFQLESRQKEKILTLPAFLFYSGLPQIRGGPSPYGKAMFYSAY
jgi:hypothetical protein